MDNHQVVTLPSFAKVNLTLDVRERMLDGYHLIQSVIQQVSLSDEVVVHLTEQEGILLDCTDPALPVDSSNLAWKAAERYYERLGVPPRVHIVLRKRIPAQAGLGGGSSNAATVLRALNILHGMPVTPEELCRLALSLGSDVPFFLQGGTALVEGFGEVITPLPAPISHTLLVVIPPVGVSTAWAYAQIDREREIAGIVDLPPPRSPALMEALRAGLDWVPLMHNDFESVVLPAVPEIQQVKVQLMSSGAFAAMLCGSGSAVMGVYPEEASAHRALRRLRVSGNRALVCTFCWR